jgi:hypothetical protein
VTRHAKASIAGSTRHSAKSRGRFRALGPALASLLLLALLAGLLPASAAAVTQPKYLGSFGPDGTEATDFESLGPIGVDEESGVVYVGDRSQDALYKFDVEGNPLNWGGSAPSISGNEISGVAWSESDVGNQIAVDPETHVVYSTNNNLRAFESNGEPHEFTAGPGAGASEIPGAMKPTGVAVDKAGNIYASYPEAGVPPKIRIFSRSGAPLTEFEPKRGLISTVNATTLAVAPDGTLYVAGSLASVYKFEPSHFPVDGSTTYSVGKQLVEGDSFTTISIALDPTTSHVYVGDAFPPSSGINRVGVYDEDDNFVGSLGAAGQEGEMQERVLGLAVNGAGERVYTADPSASQKQVKMFESFLFPVEAPTVTTTSVIDLNLYTATLRAEINPNTLASTYHFEYGLGDCAVAVNACASTPGGTIAPGHKDVGVSQEIAGLEPSTTYHYRVVAENSENITEGPDKTFTTPSTSLGFALADSRAWEKVSPANKVGGSIVHGPLGVMQAAADGDGVAYETLTSIEENPDGNRVIDLSTVLSHRDADGWRSKDITPPHTEATQIRFGGEYKAFSPNLERALLEQQDDTLLSPEASEETPYLRENTDPATYRPLITAKEGFANVQPGTVFGGSAGSAASPVAVKATNSSLTHPVVRSRTPLVPGAAANSLYMWAEGQLQPVSELPPGEGGGVVAGEAGSNWGSIRHAVSEDGSRVFWGSGGYPNLTALYVRDTVNQETGRLDVVQPGVSVEGAHNPAFHGANADGTVVFFTDSQRLTADASPKGTDLYRCEVGPVEGGALGCTSLIDVSAPIEASGEAADVLGMTPSLSEDADRAYFVARGVLDTAANEAGDSAVPGAPNLYLWEEGVGRHFVATLSERDRGDLGLLPTLLDRNGHAARLSAAASPGGRYFAFMSERSLTGYDNRDAKSEEPLEEVFRYDTVEDRLDCVSCNPSGASPTGKVSDPTASDPPRADPQSNWSERWVAAVLPSAQESEPTLGLTFHHPRVVLDNGRVFFNAVDSLVSADSNGAWDVYQWEPTGVGDCTSSSSGAAIARSAGGCVSLLSSGTAEEEASFLDASESGDDVFFLTPARLSVLDEDSELDVYDARVNGVPATLPVINECLGEACQPAPNPPNDPTPASAAFRGAGNVPSERCPASKRKVIRAGSSRCVAKKHKRKRSHKAKRAASKRRAGR